MLVSLIVAIDKNYAIGCNNQLLCHLPDDLKHFKAITINHPVIMGRKTFESIGKPLPNRTNIILTRQIGLKVEGCIVINSIPEALLYVQDKKVEEVFFIGGESVFTQVLAENRVNKIYLTEIDNEFENADSFFPKIDFKKNWSMIGKKRVHKIDEKHSFEFSISTYERKLNKSASNVIVDSMSQYKLDSLLLSI